MALLLALPPSLRRQPATRANNKTSPAKRAPLHIRRLSVLPEEDERSPSPSPSPVPSPAPAPSVASSSSITAPSSKRLSRYGKESLLAPPASDHTFERPRPAPRPPVSAQTQPSRESVRLSAFEFQLSDSLVKKERRLSRLPEGSEGVALLYSAPPSPTLSCASDVDVPYTDSNEVRLSAFPFDFIPPSLSSPVLAPPSPTTSMHSTSSSSSSAYSSSSSSAHSYTSSPPTSDLPLTPTSSDDDWPSPTLAEHALAKCAPSARPAAVVPIRPLVITKSLPSSSKCLPSSKSSRARAHVTAAVVHDEHEDDATWYARELGARFALVTPPLSASFPSSSARSRPDSISVSASTSSRARGRSRYSKPLPAIPPVHESAIAIARTASNPSLRQLQQAQAHLPSAQLDPTYASARPPLPPSPPPARLLSPLAHTQTRTRAQARRKSLTITVPHVRAQPQQDVPVPVDDIFEDADAWAPAPAVYVSGVTSVGSGMPMLSPPRIPESPYSAGMGTGASGSVGGTPLPVLATPVESVVATTPASSEMETVSVPAIVVSALEPAAVLETAVRALAQDTHPTAGVEDHTHLEDHDQDEEENHDRAPSPLLRSRWSSSTLSSLIDPPTSARTLGFQLQSIGAVARRVVRVKRASAGKSVVGVVVGGEPVFELPAVPAAARAPVYSRVNMPALSHLSSPARSHIHTPTSVRTPTSSRTNTSAHAHTPTSRRPRWSSSTSSSSAASSTGSEFDDVCSESGESTCSNGLRRKAIPVELFMRGF